MLAIYSRVVKRVDDASIYRFIHRWRKVLVSLDQEFCGSFSKLSDGVPSDILVHLEYCVAGNFFNTESSSLCNSIDCKEGTRVNKRTNGKHKKSNDSI